MASTAPLPHDEEERLADLAHYGLLDTLPERDYDDLTHLAMRLLDAPIALVTLVDRERQWFKSAQGTEISELPRDQSFCAWAILHPHEITVVEDAARDLRFAGHDFVTADPFVRFYAGAPLVNRAGRPLGTLCVLDKRPRRFTHEDREALAALARQVTSQMELRRTIIELEYERGQLREANEELRRVRRQLEKLMKRGPED